MNYGSPCGVAAEQVKEKIEPQTQINQFYWFITQPFLAPLTKPRSYTSSHHIQLDSYKVVNKARVVLYSMCLSSTFSYNVILIAAKSPHNWQDEKSLAGNILTLPYMACTLPHILRDINHELVCVLALVQK